MIIKFFKKYKIKYFYIYFLILYCFIFQLTFGDDIYNIPISQNQLSSNNFSLESKEEDSFLMDIELNQEQKKKKRKSNIKV
jgi:hypothetical protein